MSTITDDLIYVKAMIGHRGVVYHVAGKRLSWYSEIIDQQVFVRDSGCGVRFADSTTLRTYFSRYMLVGEIDCKRCRRRIPSMILESRTVTAARVECDRAEDQGRSGDADAARAWLKEHMI